MPNIYQIYYCKIILSNNKMCDRYRNNDRQQINIINLSTENENTT